MLHSSGTTGRPKGIRQSPQGRTLAEGLELVPFLTGAFGFDASSVYLSPAPLYHSAPLGFTTTVLGHGADLTPPTVRPQLGRGRSHEAAAETTSRNVARATPLNSPAVAVPPEPRANPS